MAPERERERCMGTGGTRSWADGVWLQMLRRGLITDLGIALGMFLLLRGFRAAEAASSRRGGGLEQSRRTGHHGAEGGGRTRANFGYV